MKNILPFKIPLKTNYFYFIFSTSSKISSLCAISKHVNTQTLYSPLFYYNQNILYDTYHIVWLLFAYSAFYVWQSLPGHETCKRNGDLKLMSIFFKWTITWKDKAFCFSCTFYILLYSNQHLIAIDACSTQNIDIE